MATAGFDNASAGEETPKDQDKRRRIRQAMIWLEQNLGDHPRPALEMLAAAEAAGFPRSTVTEARKRLGIKSKRRGEAWYWQPKRKRAKQAVTV